MHRAALLMRASLAGSPNRHALQSRVLSAAESSSLSAALNEDASDYYYSGCASLASALAGINGRLYSWAAVQLYYAVFYCLRARLALAGIGIFHVGSSPFSIQAVAGSTPGAVKGNTHKSVLKTFEKHFPNSKLLSQKIGTDDPLDWLMLRREEANYGMARFIDPVVPDHFKEVERYGLRRVVSTYIDDTVDAYTFDPDHAMVAYPLAVMRDVSGALLGYSPTLSGIERTHLQYTCRDSAGPLNYLLPLFR